MIARLPTYRPKRPVVEDELTPLWWSLRDAGWTSAADILSYFRVTLPPVNVEDIAARMQIGVARVQAKGWSGAVRTDEGSASIWIHENEAPHRQRFTIAHEIGHLMLHPDEDGRVFFRDTSFFGNAREVEANRFAADLLMPKHLVNAAMSALGAEVSRLAKVFQVSDEAMAIRLKEILGIR